MQITQIQQVFSSMVEHRPSFAENFKDAPLKSLPVVISSALRSLSNRVSSLVQEGYVADVLFWVTNTWKDAGICLGLSQFSDGWLDHYLPQGWGTALRTSILYQWYVKPFQTGSCENFKVSLIPVGYALVVLSTSLISRITDAVFSRRARPS